MLGGRKIDYFPLYAVSYSHRPRQLYFIDWENTYA